MCNKGDHRLFQIKELLSEAAGFLRAAGIEEPRLEAGLLLAQVLEMERTRLLMEEDRIVEKEPEGIFRDLIRRRADGEPFQYLTGHKEFMGREFLVDSRVLIPRNDTAVLAEAVMEHTPRGILVDVCTGSGILAVTLKLSFPELDVYGLDLSEGALAVARENGRRLGAEVTWLKSDLLEGLPEVRPDVVMANPPYIPTGDLEGLPGDVRREPAGALDGGEDGLFLYRRLVPQAAGILKNGGLLAVEIGYNQGEEVKDLFLQAGFAAVEIRKDYAGLSRVVLGVKP